MMATAPDQSLRSLFLTAIDAVSAEHRIADYLPPPPVGRTVVVGAGKAAAAMAKAVEKRWPGDLSGAVVTPYGHAVHCDRIDIIEAAHPVPNDAGLIAARQMLDLVNDLGTDDLVLALISGGGSALLVLPAPGLTLADKQSVTHDLLRSGASIGEINTVRKHLSAIKGGRLAQAAHPARVVTLLISDIPGDDPSMVASGPTVADTTSAADARAILAERDIVPPEAVATVLEAGRTKTHKPDDPAFLRDDVSVIARAKDALDAASEAAEQEGWVVDYLGDSVEGEARKVARAHARRVFAAVHSKSECPRLIVSGGETTVTIAGDGGKGGRNTEYLLALGLALEGQPNLWAIACDTDGIDGNTDAAGAILTPDSLDRARAIGLDPQALLQTHESGTLFAALGDLIQTGPTRTNVNDFRAILISASTDAEVDL